MVARGVPVVWYSSIISLFQKSSEVTQSTELHPLLQLESKKTNLNTSITKHLLNETNKSMVMATRNMPEFENEAQTDLYCIRRELALVGQTQFIQSLEEGWGWW